MRKKSLMHKTLTQFIACVAVLLLLAAPLFYWLTRNFYAEDMIDLIEAVQKGGPMPAFDLEEDIMHGIMIQFGIIAAVLGIAIVLTLRFISKRMWQPFDRTLEAIEGFRLESGACPSLQDSDIREFSRLNTALTRLMNDNLRSYRLQKEFTENASHELQTPLAVFQSKLDILLQQPELTELQAATIQDLYRMNSRLSRLSRNLLLLAKMENRQFNRTETVDVVGVLNELLPALESLAEGVTLLKDFQVSALPVRANRSLLESMINNLFVNAIRHNKPGGSITLACRQGGLSVSNTSLEPALNEQLIFTRFYPSSENTKGNGLGLAIVKAVCDYHGWKVTYTYQNGTHVFDVHFL